MDMNYKQKLPKIKHLLLDVDGVLTDGTVFFDHEGRAQRRLFTKDSFAIQLAIRQGLRIGIITGGSGAGLLEAFRELGIQDIYTRSSDKLDAYKDYLAVYDCAPDSIAYMGDDLPDYAVMERVGLSCCPSDAATYIRERVDYVSAFPGGGGAVRDILEQWLRVNDLFQHPDKWTW